jgi:hypothetical protein
MPRLCYVLDDLSFGQLRESINVRYRLLDAKIIDGKNVWSPEREHQNHMGRPGANPLYFVKFAYDGLVALLRQVPQI